jgi:hypothetical protein
MDKTPACPGLCHKSFIELQSKSRLGLLEAGRRLALGGVVSAIGAFLWIGDPSFSAPAPP